MTLDEQCGWGEMKKEGRSDEFDGVELRHYLRGDCHDPAETPTALLPPPRSVGGRLG